jgi:hypothetical protein
MTIALRPMSQGEILDRTFQIYRSRFWVFVGIAAVPAVWMSAIYLLNLLWWKLRVPSNPLCFLGIGISQLVYLLLAYHVSLFFSCVDVADCESRCPPSLFWGRSDSVGVLSQDCSPVEKSFCFNGDSLVRFAASA